jgi:hypothetical protein
MTEIANQGDYARVLRLARDRQKRWYHRNVEKLVLSNERTENYLKN